MFSNPMLNISMPLNINVFSMAMFNTCVPNTIVLINTYVLIMMMSTT